MIVFTFGDIVGLAVLGFFLLLLFALLLHGGWKRVSLKKAGFPEVDVTCQTALHCKWYECGYCTKPDFDCQFNPKRPVSQKRGRR